MSAMLARLALALPLFAMPAAAALALDRLAGLAHVIDGDTIAVSGIHVRLKGVAAPEVAHPGDAGEPGGPEARAFMVRLIEGRTVVCDLTNERTHGRRVGWCYLRGRDVAELLIRARLARDCPRFSGGRYAAAERPEARALPLPGYCAPR